MPYCPDVFNARRRTSLTVRIGRLLMGGNQPVRVQSMTNTSTLDTEGCIVQALRLAETGAELVRLTAQGEREAANLSAIKAGLLKRGCNVPLVADIHFNPKAADEAALHVEKVRINPGNYVDPVKTFRHFDYTDEEYAQEVQKIRTRFLPFLELCKKHGRAIRIGVNHGSLSDRIMSRYGDTAEGMVESCLEFLRLCVEAAFTNVVISIKASNTLVMVQTVRLLVDRMHDEGMQFPLHLGVTEAGDGEDGRIKSAVGIGSLLLDGIGDTIRVSLSEDPEREIPVARQLLACVEQRMVHEAVKAEVHPSFNPFRYRRRETDPVGRFGGNQVPVVMLGNALSCEFSKDAFSGGFKPDYCFYGIDGSLGFRGLPGMPSHKGVLGYIQALESNQKTSNPISIPTYPVFESDHLKTLQEVDGNLCFVKLTLNELDASMLESLKRLKKAVVLLFANSLGERRAFFHTLMHADCRVPVVLCMGASTASLEVFQLEMSLDAGPLLLDGFGDGILYAPMQSSILQPDAVSRVLYGVLQATRLRISKTEYISCPGCGRTLFDLQHTIARIKSQTAHLKGLKIGIMGCIVNGPGEMADADYGYVGAARGKVSLYKGQTCVEKNIPAAQAVEKLIELIKQHGDWREP